ncbi:FusB/FusC family EF-G-binding protein [Paenibacillus thailandensis]|uniref:FusB/FusC family EF-G-binding protein n=1 Tax=Paenibacillus thailandensis TaxID=393250 RepID=A0ABW5QXU5_9BACL
MNKPFIRNHQYNLIRKQVKLLQQTCATVSDPKVVESVRGGVQTKLSEAFPEGGAFPREMLDAVTSLSTEEQFRQYLQSLEPYLDPFPQVTAKQLGKLFPKVKKLKTPELAGVDYRYVTYISWIDIALNKMFLVYHMNGQFVGIQGNFTPVNKGVCFLCNRHEQVALFSAITKWKPADASPDYYKAIGNYMCMDSEVCNRNITDVAALEKFIQAVTVKTH